MDSVSEINAMEFKTDEEKSRMTNEKERVEKAIEDIVSKLSKNINNFMTFGFELRKTDED